MAGVRGIGALAYARNLDDPTRAQLCEKKQYGSQMRALYAANTLGHRFRLKLYVYFCWRCGGWHLTKMEQR